MGGAVPVVDDNRWTVNVAGLHSFHYHDGRLHCENVDLEQVAEKHGTPLYVYSAGTIVDHYRRLHSALNELDHLICYAVKANSIRHRLWR